MELALSIVIAHVFYAVVEKQFRVSSSMDKKSKDKRFYAVIAIFIFCLASSIAVYKLDGIPSRVSSEVNAVQNNIDFKPGLEPNCMYKYRRKAGGIADCKFGDQKLKKELILWGDSHAGYSAKAIVDLAKNKGYSARVYSYPLCPPIFDTILFGRTFGEKCGIVTKDTFADVVANKKAKDVFLFARWGIYTPKEYEREGPGQPLVFTDNQNGEIKAYMNKLVETACELKKNGKNVHLVKSAPDMPVYVPKVYAKYLMLNWKKDISISEREYNAHNLMPFRAFEEAKKKCGIDIVNTNEYFCKNRVCGAIRDGHSLYNDDTHLSTYGDDVLYKALEKALNKK